MTASTFGRAFDTSDEASEAQVRRWREMTPEEKAHLAAALHRATVQMIDAGIVARYPSASSRERFLRRAVLMLGCELAVKVYPDAASLSD